MEKFSKLFWIEDVIKLGQLKGYDKNPRRINKADFNRLVNDIKQDGYHRRIMVTHDNVIIGGHARKKALLAAGYTQTDNVTVLRPSRSLTEEEIKRLNIRDNLSFGEWDIDILANNFDEAELKSWGMPDIIFDYPKQEVEMTASENFSLPKKIICPQCGCEYDNSKK